MSATPAGYIRVSSPSQDYAYQRHAIEIAARARGERIDHWYADISSGASKRRPELGRLWRALEQRAVSRLWVWRLDRLTRAGIAETFENVRFVRSSGAELVSVADQFALDGGPAAELVLAVLAWCAQMEREKIRENQEAARARMRRQGRTFGRPPLADHLRDEVIALSSQRPRPSLREIARRLHVSKSWVDGVLSHLGQVAAAKNG